MAVTSREIKALPPSWSFVARTICGTKTAVNAPPIIKLYRIFGIVFATLKVSPSKVVPRTATKSNPRANPVIRETIVPTAMIVEDFKSEWLVIYIYLTFLSSLSDPSEALN